MAAVKVFPAGLAFWPARSEGVRPLLVALAVAVAICLVTLPVVGIDEWSRFVAALSNAEPACDGGRVSIACLVGPHVGWSAGKAAGVVVGAVLLLVSLRIRGDLAAFTALTLGMLAPAADGHAHYLLFGYVLLVIGACRLGWWPFTRRG
jgi:hypothetical protein